MAVKETVKNNNTDKECVPIILQMRTNGREDTPEIYFKP
tara:strand:- start:223 stop:339 length:117 start_codon:yes stop_codon:yes gene_type:complete